MLHILLLLLKIIGIILLAVLALLLLFLLAVLFVPVRYKGDGSYHGGIKGTAAVTWLFRAVSFRLAYDRDMAVSFKLFGFPLISEKGEKEDDDFAVQAAELGGGREAPSEGKRAEPPKDQTQEPVPQNPKEETQEPPAAEIEAPKPSAEKGKKEDGAPEPEKPKESRLVRFLNRLKEKTLALWKRLCGTVRGLLKKKEELLKKYRKAREFLEKEENQKTFKLVIRQGKRIFFHLFPKKLEGHIRFGLEDPYRMGQILCIISPFYGFYGKNLEIEPVFDETALEGEVSFKGRIRLGTLLFLGLRLLADKNFRVLLRRWRRR